MTDDEKRARIKELDEKIAGAKQWGSVLTAWSEERTELFRSLRAVKVEVCKLCNRTISGREEDMERLKAIHYLAEHCG